MTTEQTAKWPGDAHYPHEKLENVIRGLLYPEDMRAMMKWALAERIVAFMHGQPGWAKDLVERIDTMTHDPSIAATGRGTAVDWVDAASDEQLRDVARLLFDLFERATEMNARQMTAAGVQPTFA